MWECGWLDAWPSLCSEKEFVTFCAGYWWGSGHAEKYCPLFRAMQMTCTAWVESLSTTVVWEVDIDPVKHESVSLHDSCF